MVLSSSAATRATTPEKQTRVAVVVDASEDTSEHARVAHDVRRALKRRSDYKLMQIHGVLNAGDEVEAQNDIKTAQGFHEAGQNAFDAGEIEDARLAARSRRSTSRSRRASEPRSRTCSSASPSRAR